MSGIFLEALIRATETQGQPRRKSDLTRGPEAVWETS